MRATDAVASGHLLIYSEAPDPPGDRYKYKDIHLRDCPPDEPENAHAHLAAMLLGSSEANPVVDGAIVGRVSAA